MEKGHRIRSGTHAVVDLTSTYEVRLLATQTDQDAGARWGVNSTIAIPARLRTAISGKVVADGYYTFQWTFTGMTFDMFDYFCDQFLPSNVWSAAVTVMQYDRGNDAQYFTATILRPASPPIITIGYQNVTFDFIKGTIIT